MLKDPIVVGKAYVNEDARVIREVIEEVDGRRVRFNAFDLATGRLIPAPHRICHRHQLARWAQREASGPETALLHPYERTAQFAALLPRDQGSVELERAKALLDRARALHTFPQVK